MRLFLEFAPQTAALCDDRGNTPFHLAARCGSVPAMELLLSAAPDTLVAVNSSGQSALHAAADWMGSEQAVRWLLQAAPQLAAVRDRQGRSAMHEAASTERSGISVIHLLAAARPELVTVTDYDGQSPLHVASYSGNERAIRALLELAPQAAMAVDSRGQTPLHASANGRFAMSRPQQAPWILELLEAAPAAARVQDRNGRTPLELLLNDRSGIATAGELGVRDPQAALQLLRATKWPADPAFLTCLVACLPLSAFEWASLPAACLAAALPAALAHSPARARLLVEHLPSQDAARLRTLALCLARVQRSMSAQLPLPLQQHILTHAGTLLC